MPSQRLFRPGDFTNPWDEPKGATFNDRADPRQSGRSLRVEHLAHQYIVRTRKLGTSKAAADTLPIARRNLDKLVKNDPNFRHEHTMALDEVASNRLESTGIDCPNDCGPVILWTQCPGCGWRCRPSRKKERTECNA